MFIKHNSLCFKDDLLALKNFIVVKFYINFFILTFDLSAMLLVSDGVLFEAHHRATVDQGLRTIKVVFPWENEPFIHFQVIVKKASQMRKFFQLAF